MPSFTFTLSPTGVTQIHDALSCLARFDENVCLEATAGELRISSLNSTKTAYASFIFSARTFFDEYHFSSATRSSPKVWACRIQNRALLSILKKRIIKDKEKDQETAIECCEFELQNRDDLTKCRLVFKLFCRFSVVKTFRLTYETAEVLHATFDRQASPNTWTINSRTLRDVVEYFGPKTEHVDWSMNDGKVTFTSYTEKIQVGSEIIRQPTHTSVQLDGQDFDECKIEKDLHISIPVKDFRSIVAHAETMKANVKAAYSFGHRPTQITYGSGGLTAEFTLMTKGTSSAIADSSRASTPARGLSVRPRSQVAGTSRAGSLASFVQSGLAPAEQDRHDAQSRTRPPKPSGPELVGVPSVPKPVTKVNQSNSGDTSAPPASVNPDSLFFPAPEDDDQHWDPPNFDDEHEMVSWDNTGLSGIWNPPGVSKRQLQDHDSAATSFRSAFEGQHGRFEIGPTQGRLSQVKGMFD